jgi:hypothetical protein
LITKLHDADFVNFISNYDVICLTETQINFDLSVGAFKDFEIFSSHAKKLSHQGRFSGGVSVLVKKHLTSHVKKVKVDADYTVVLQFSKHVFGFSKDLFYIGIYLPPQESKYWKTKEEGYGIEILEKCLADLKDTYPDFSTMICGDLNARTAEANYSFDYSEDAYEVNKKECDIEFTRASYDKETNPFGESLLELCNIFDFIILNGLTDYNYDGSSTYVSTHGTSVIDYFILSLDMAHFLVDCSLNVMEQVDSDHLPVEFFMPLIIEQTVKSQVKKVDTIDEKLFWQKEKEAEFIANLNSEENILKLGQAFEKIDVNFSEALSQFTVCLKSAAKCMIKKQGVNKNAKNAVWYDKDCRDAKKVCKKKLRKFRKQRTEKERKDFVASRSTYKKMVKQKRQQYRRNTAETLANSVQNSSAFWKLFKNLEKNKRCNVGDNISTEDWYNHFKNVFGKMDITGNEEIRIEKDVTCDPESSLNSRITRDEVKNAIKNFNSGKAGGIDGIVSEMLKAGGYIVEVFFTEFFNKIFDSGLYPEEWAKAIVVPIFKKGDTKVLDNYRGISLINVACKCYTSILNKRLYAWLEENNGIVENQAGFRKNYSTTDQIFSLYSVVQKVLSKKGQKLYVAFVDFRKAFDSVNHDKLMHVLYSEGVRGKFFVTVKCMYESLLSCVRSCNGLSEYFECPVGVRQGCVMSPTLFSMFINQLAVHINNSGVHGVQLLPTMLELFILLFADDVALLSTTPRGLQAQLNTLKKCCDDLKLTVNKDKTKIMVFRKGGFLGQREKWYFEGKQIEVVNSYCYLGFTFTTMLSLKLGTNPLAAKGRKAVYNLSQAFQNCKEMTKNTFFKVFDSKVQSILLYSSEVWGFQRLENLEKVHMLACKRFLGVPIKTPNKMIYAEIGRYPLFINSQIRCLKYWFRLIKMDPNRLPKQAYSMLFLLDSNGKKCWASEVRELLSNSGFYYVWLNQGVENVSAFLSAFKQRSLDMYMQQWCELTFLSAFKQQSLDMYMQQWCELTRDKERYRLFTLFKHDFACSSYILDMDVYCFRVAFTQIRLGVLPLNSNMFRFDQRDQTCTFCKAADENEHHFLFECILYSDLRTKFLANLLCIPLFKLLKGKDTQITRNVAKFIFHAMRRRSTINE